MDEYSPYAEPEFGKRAVKFDFDSKTESLYVILFYVGLLLMISGLILINKIGLIPCVAGVILMLIGGIFRKQTDDYLILDPNEKNVIIHEKFFFYRSAHPLCPLNEMVAVKLDHKTHVEGGKHNKLRYADFFVSLTLPGNKIINSAGKASLNDYRDTVFDKNVAQLRNLALEIATISDCPLYYSLKIPAKECLKRGLKEN